MYRYLLTAVLAFSLLACQAEQQAVLQEPISAQEAQQLITQSPEVKILDVRTPAEFQEGHLQGALNLDFQGPDFEKQVAQLDPQGNYLLYCASGRRSAAAQELMNSKGFLHVNNLKDGIQGWQSAGLPVQKP